MDMSNEMGKEIFEKGYKEGIIDGKKIEVNRRIEVLIKMMIRLLNINELLLRKTIIKGADGLPEEYVDRIVKILAEFDDERSS